MGEDDEEEEEAADEDEDEDEDEDLLGGTSQVSMIELFGPFFSGSIF